MKFTMKKLGKVVLTAALVGIVAAALTGCSKKGDSSASGSDGQKKVINVAYTNYYVPYDFVNDKGEADGFERVLDQCESSSLAWVNVFQQQSNTNH